MLLIIVIQNNKFWNRKRKMMEEKRRTQPIRLDRKNKILDLELVRQSKIQNQQEIYQIWSIFQKMSLKNSHKI